MVLCTFGVHDETLVLSSTAGLNNLRPVWHLLQLSTKPEKNMITTYYGNRQKSKSAGAKGKKFE